MVRNIFSAVKRGSITGTLACICLATSFSVASLQASALPSVETVPHRDYQPVVAVSGGIRIWGSPDDRRLLSALERDFRRYHPEVEFSYGLYGAESALAGVYGGVADLALMGRELREPLERMAYEWVKLDRPFLIEVANAALTSPRHSNQLAVVVHQDNPLPSLTMAELDAILGTERRLGGAPVSVWADLGVQGSLADRAIQPYGPAVDSITGQVIRQKVLADSRKWNPAYREIDPDELDATKVLASDTAAIGVIPVRAVQTGMRVIGLSRKAGDTPLLPSPEAVRDGQYPLARAISVAIAHTAAQSAPNQVKAFVDYVLSAQGQAVIRDEGDYLPLSSERAAVQYVKLTSPVEKRKATGDKGDGGSLTQVGPKHVVLSQVDLPSPYVPETAVHGRLRIWGHGSYGAHTDFVEGLTRAWQDGFRRHHPGIEFENRLHGTASAIGALYTGTGDLAFMGREIWQPEIDAFREVRGYAPLGVDVLTGSYDVRNKGYAISVFVHRDNPLSALTLAQLDAVYSVDRRRGHAAVSTWGDLGVIDPHWRDRRIQLYGLPIARGFADYFQTEVFQGSLKWKPELREFADEPGSRGGEQDGGYKMVRTMADDPDAIGYAGMLYRHPSLKPLALARGPDDEAVLPTIDSVAAHRYPLTRFITMFIDRKPGQSVDPKVAEFLRYILSEEGQQAVIHHGQGYLPVPSRVAEREKRKLN